MNLDFKVMVIPEIPGENGHPRICIFIKHGCNGYIVRGFCGDYSCWEFHADEEIGINSILLKISRHLQKLELN